MKPFIRLSEGRRGAAILRLQEIVSTHTVETRGMLGGTDSASIDLGGSIEDWRVIGAGESSIMSSSWSSSTVGVDTGVGDVTSICVLNGSL